jgi:hypothetical protein
MARDYGYIISPSLARYVFKPGNTVSDSFNFTNSFVTGEPAEQTFVASIKFLYQKEGAPYLYDAVPASLSSYSMNDWVTLSKKEFVVKQNQTVKLDYTIKVPDAPQPGGKYAAIVIERKNSIPTQDINGAKLSDRISFEILGNVAGTEKRDSETVGLTVNKPIFWSWPNESAIFTLNMKNTGNVESLPTGDIFIHQGDITQAVWNSAFNPDQLVILPGNTREYKVTWQASGPLFKTTQNGVTINLDYFRVGRYIATAKVGNDVDGKRVISDQVVSFWILPLPLIIAILTVIIVSFLGIVLWRKRRNHKRA